MVKEKKTGVSFPSFDGLDLKFATKGNQLGSLLPKPPSPLRAGGQGGSPLRAATEATLGRARDPPPATPGTHLCSVPSLAVGVMALLRVSVGRNAFRTGPVTEQHFINTRHYNFTPSEGTPAD